MMRGRESQESFGFLIRPYCGVAGVRFGMTPPAVAALLGPPLRCVRNYLGERKDVWTGIKVCYDGATEGLIEIQLSRPSKAVYDGIDLLEVDDLVRTLLRHDPAPLESVGVALFMKLGISINVPAPGPTQSDPQRTLGIFANGRWDRLLPRFGAYQTTASSNP